MIRRVGVLERWHEVSSDKRLMVTDQRRGKPYRQVVLDEAGLSKYSLSLALTNTGNVGIHLRAEWVESNSHLDKHGMKQ